MCTMKQKIRFGWCLAWFILASMYFSSPAVFAAQSLALDDYEDKEIPILLSWKGGTDVVKNPTQDTNWWFWNQEAKEKQRVTLDGTQKKEVDETHKKVEKRSVRPFIPDTAHLRSFFSDEPLPYHVVKKRWLSGSFGTRGRRKQQKEHQKWLIDSQLSGWNSLPSTHVVQDPWMMSKRKMQMHRKDHQTDVKPQQQFSAKTKVDAGKNNFHSKNISLQQKYIENHPAVKVDNMLLKSFNLNYKKENNLDPSEVMRLPEQRAKTYGYRRQQPSSGYQRVWNKSDEPDMTPYEEVRFNPVENPYSLHDLRSSIRWYSTPNYRWDRTSKPPLEGQVVLNDDGLSPSVEKENGEYDEITKAKGVAKFKDKKTKEISERERSRGKYELMPKIYALNDLRNGKMKYKNYNDHYGLSADSATNPIVVPGFKRKHAEAPDDEQVSLRPYIIRTEERKSPFNDEFLQVPRASRNQTKNEVSINDNSNVNAGGMQPPPLYGFPGGVNISILVPNPPAASSHEIHPSTMSLTSTHKNIKKKKERKKKVKNDDEPLKDLLSAPRSLVSTPVNIRRFPYTEKTVVNPLIGDDDQSISGMELMNYKPQLNSTIVNVNHPVIDLKPDNYYSLLSHIRNLNRLDLDHPLFGIHNDEVRKPVDYREEDDDDDEIRMLYDEQTSSTITLQSDEDKQTGQPVSFSRYRLPDHPARNSSVRDVWGIGKYSTTTNSEQILGFDFGDRVKNDKYLNIKYNPGNVKFKSVSNRQPLRRTAMVTIRVEHECKAMSLEDSELRKHHESEHLSDKTRDSKASDQWDALDEALKSEMSGKSKDVAWQTRNRKRDADYETCQPNDEQGYYRLSAGGNSFRNPTDLIMSVFRAKPNKHRERDYYDDIPEERIREPMRPNIVVPPT